MKTDTTFTRFILVMMFLITVAISVLSVLVIQDRGLTNENREGIALIDSTRFTSRDFVTFLTMAPTTISDSSRAAIRKRLGIPPPEVALQVTVDSLKHEMDSLKMVIQGLR